jgi:hypothetical protein
MHRVSTAAAAILAGCVFAATVSAERPRFNNSIKYRDSVPAARGRSGSAAIEARALLDKNGMTILDVTTGSFDGVAATGNLDKVQVKIPTAGDTVTINHTNLSGGGTFSSSIEDLGRHAPLHVQANVSGIDPNRTDVVSATETVKLRPDLAVTAVTVPPHALLDLPVRVTALVTERNGDVGARADCVLYAGGVEVRRAYGIWVDAGSAVTCSFATTFDQAGVKDLRVVVEGVTPGDYDSANDSNVAQTQIYARTEPFPQWSTWAQEFRDQSMYRTWSSVYSTYKTQDEYRQVSSISTAVFGPMNLQSLQVTASIATDGETIYVGDEIATEYEKLPEELFGDRSLVELYGDGFDGIVWSTGSGANQQSTVDLRRLGGYVTYHSEGWEILGNGTTYTWNTDEGFSVGTVARPFGDTVSMTMTISDGTTMWESNDSLMPMNPFESVDHQSVCFERRRYGLVCEEWSNDMHGKWGFDGPGVVR